MLMRIMQIQSKNLVINEFDSNFIIEYYTPVPYGIVFIAITRVISIDENYISNKTLRALFIIRFCDKDFRTSTTGKIVKTHFFATWTRQYWMLIDKNVRRPYYVLYYIIVAGAKWNGS